MCPRCAPHRVSRWSLGNEHYDMCLPDLRCAGPSLTIWASRRSASSRDRGVAARQGSGQEPRTGAGGSEVPVDDPKRELRAFTVSLTANVGTKRRQDKGSFVSSVVSAIDRFFAEVVQHIKPWTQAPPKVKDDEPSPADQTVPAEMAVPEAHDIEIGNGLPSRESTLAPTLGLTESAGHRPPEAQ